MTYLGPDLPMGSLAKPAIRGPKPPQRIRRRGPRTIEYEDWRDNVAIPFLNATTGYRCAACGDMHSRLDVDHIQPRGSHPELKMKLLNVQYLCRKCHLRKTDHLTTFPVTSEELIL